MVIKFSQIEIIVLKDIRTCRDYKDNPIDLLNKAIGELNLSGRKIGVEMEGINAKDFLKFQEYIRGIGSEIIDATSLLAEVRSIKTPEEIEFDTFNLVRGGDIY